MYYEEGASHQLHGERTSWGSSQNLQLGNLEFNPSSGWQDVCFNVTGNWRETGSSATLVATLIFDRCNKNNLYKYLHLKYFGVLSVQLKLVTLLKSVLME